MPPGLELIDLRRRFGDVVALDEVRHFSRVRPTLSELFREVIAS